MRRRATLSKEEENMAVAEESWMKKYLGEVLGVFVLVFLGDSFVAYAVSGGKNGFLAGLLAAGFFWGFAVTLAIYACGAVSGAHLNPAVTLALAWRRGFPWSKVPGYIVAQVVGAFLAAAGVSFVWIGLIAPIEMASLNPARDFGPRLWMLLIGYGSNAIPGPNFNIWITTLMPLVGGPLGAYIYDFVVHQHLPVPVGPDVPEKVTESARARA